MRRSRLVALSTSLAISLVLAAPTAQAAGPASAHYARGTEGVFWFLHVSDVHTGTEMFPGYKQNQDFAYGPVVQTIKPWFFVATGDLVDASPNGIPTSGQDPAEWAEYKALYQNAGLKPDFYFDLPGNHDGYGDYGMTRYLANSLQGSTNNALTTSWTVDTPVGKYLFLGLNSVGNGSPPGFQQPEFRQEDILAAQQALIANQDAELVFFLAHHRLTEPTNSDQIVSLMTSLGGGFYLHGDVHEYKEYTDGDPSIVVNEVNSLGKSKVDNLAVGVVDHNAFVYRATSTQTPWPLVIITAPVSTTLRDGEANPYAYTVCRDRKDNPVRAVVFGDPQPTAVGAQVGTSPAIAMKQAGTTGNLWEGELDTSELLAGLTDVTVTASSGDHGSYQTITIELVDGPCDPLPGDPPPDAGPDAQPEAGGSGGSGNDTGGAGGSSGTGGSMTSDAGTDSGDGVQVVAPVSEDAGCSCTTAGRRGSSAGFGLLGLVGAGVVVRRRKR